MPLPENILTLDELEAAEANAYPAGFRVTGQGKKSAVTITGYEALNASHAAEALANPPTSSHRPPSLQNIRQTHHRLAQLMSAGIKDVEVSRITGYSPQRITILRSDPAFQELLSHYEGRVDEEWMDFVSRAKGVTLDLLDHLQETLETNPEKFTPTTTIAAITALADRTGHSPIQRNLNVNVNTDMGSRLRAARERASAAMKDALPNGE